MLGNLNRLGDDAALIAGDFPAHGNGARDCYTRLMNRRGVDLQILNLLSDVLYSRRVAVIFRLLQALRQKCDFRLPFFRCVEIRNKQIVDHNTGQLRITEFIELRNKHDGCFRRSRIIDFELFDPYA